MRHITSEGFDFVGVNETLDQLEIRCRSFQKKAGAEAEFIGIDWATEARYPDQAWEIEVPLRRPRFSNRDDVKRLVADFHEAHKDLFAVNDPQSPIEMIGWSATIRCRIGSPRAGRVIPSDANNSLPDRRVYFHPTGWMRAAVHRLETLEPDLAVIGPAVVESGFTSVVVDPGASARKTRTGCLVVDVTA